MINSLKNLGSPANSYLRTSYLLFFIWLMTGLALTGCDSRDKQSALGAVAGVAHLSAPDPGTGHAGILVYLAGTPYQARTDQQGRYRIDAIAAGTYDLIAEKQNFQGQVIEGLIVPAATESSLPVQPTQVTLPRITNDPTTAAVSMGAIEGNVFLEGMPDENGGVRVEVDGTAFVTVSSNDGQYRIMNVQPGTYRLSFYRDGYLPGKTSSPTIVSTGTLTTVEDVALELMQPGDPVSAASVAAQAATSAVAPASVPQEPPPGPEELRSIIGVVDVRDQAGRTISDFSDVTIAINGTNRVADIDDQGQFRFDGLTSGVYTVIGTIPEGPVVQVPVDLAAQRSASITVKMTLGAIGDAGGSVRGRVVLVDMDDKPLPDSSGVQVAVNGTQSLATTAADGNFAIAGVPAGNYTISATKEGFKPGQATNVEVTPTAPVDVGEITMTMDVTRPRVVSTTPVNNASDVTVGFNLPITIKFSEAMNPATVREGITFTPATPFTVAMGKGSAPGADDNTLVIMLSNESNQAPIQFGASYRVTVPGTAANFAGVTMGQPYSFSFRTAKPGVIQTVPVNNANGVYVDQTQNPVLFSFNTRLDPRSINDRSIRVRPDNGISVATTYADSDENGWTTVRVATQWKPDTLYTVTVTRRVKALNGQPLGNTPYTLKFRTAPLELMSVPIITKR